MKKPIMQKISVLIFVLLVYSLLASAAFGQNQLKIYGYFSTRLEKVFSEPSLVNGGIEKETAPSEWSYPSFNIMMQHQLNSNFKIFANLSGADAAEIGVQNFWGEYSASEKFNLRFGKIYRKFGLYNEILDAVPTYYGIEPPELFDGDHLIVSRTTTVMVHGGFSTNTGILNYSFSTDNGEGGPMEDSHPLGWDFNYKFGNGDYTIGTSGYTSGGKTVSDKGIGEGSPKTGVLPWMAEDEFTVFGGYFEGLFSNLTLQFEFWQSAHTALRDPNSVVTMLNSATVHDRDRFLINPNAPVTTMNVNANGDYDINTWYIRAGYSIDTEKGEFGPYFQWDYYSNPETIQSKSYGGDNEAGASDDGKFNKLTLGILFRPVQEVAFKLDFSSHRYKLNGGDVSYPELRFDISYIFGQ